MGQRLDFFIAGVQKGGTTALDSILRSHPTIQMAAIKEAHFFDSDHVNWAKPDYLPLHQLFDWSVQGMLRGEATPIYLYWPHSLERLHAYNPNARLIIGLRHPAFRAHSHWKMEFARGLEELDFSESIRTGRNRVAKAALGAHRVHSYVERGYYDRQIARAFELFSESQIHIFRTDRVWQHTDEEIQKIEAFLGVGHELQPVREYIVPVAASPSASMSASDREYLDDLFLPSIRRLITLTGIDFSDWLDSNYSEPMSPPLARE